VSYILYKIGSRWLEVIKRLKDELLLNEFKNEMANLTLVGEYVGYGLNYIMKYPQSSIFFSSIVTNININNPDNNGDKNNIALTPKVAYSFFKKYKLLIAPIEKVCTDLRNFDDFNIVIKNLYHSITSSLISFQEEGAVKYFKY
jgi:hypothetical protein